MSCWFGHFLFSGSKEVTFLKTIFKFQRFWLPSKNCPYTIHKEKAEQVELLPPCHLLASILKMASAKRKVSFMISMSDSLHSLCFGQFVTSYRFSDNTFGLWMRLFGLKCCTPCLHAERFVEPVARKAHSLSRSY